ncbi:MAG: hypothetical protein WC360_04430 [Opitutales bacterium]|jgi:protein-tyrosine phosphatase
MKEILFICTGNYYRSRFAEALFNFEAKCLELPWRAFSRGLAIHMAEGDISYHTELALERRGIALCHTGRTRVALCAEDFARASRIIALDEREHRPMVQEQFPELIDRVEFWTCQDMPWDNPEHCLPSIEKRVSNLLSELES